MLQNLPFSNVTILDGFWKSRYDLNRKVSIRSVYERFEETARFDSLRFVYRKTGQLPHIFYDSDFAKWVEAVAYLIINDKDGYKAEQAVIDAIVVNMAENQLADGYLNGHFIQCEPHKRFTDRSMHELYCAGHLIEAAIAYDMATQKSAFLDIMKKYVDCIEHYFVTEKLAAFTTCGHEEIELALLKLFDYTGEKRYLNLALFFINQRGVVEEGPASPTRFNKKYNQSEVPVRELEEAEGHAVRAMYLYIAMAEAALKTNDEGLRAACRRLWRNIVDKKMYITGGIGSGKQGEAFTKAYDLPNLEAYSESCAAIGLVLFALSMQKTELCNEYGAVIERILYNGLLSSTSLDGKAFFYENPLEIHLDSVGKDTAVVPKSAIQLPIRHRLEVFSCSCCPPNINRIFARIGDLFFSTTGNAFVVNQYGAVSYKDESTSITISTDYPNNGKVTLHVKRCEYDEILLRIPEWCEQFTVSVPYIVKNGYVAISASTGTIELDFHMEPYFVECNPRSRANNGRVALCYGPVVYCIERLDNDFELNALTIDPKTKVTVGEVSAEYGMRSLKAPALVDRAFPTLYRKASVERDPVELAFRPYYSFANREECDMLIWLRCQ